MNLRNIVAIGSCSIRLSFSALSKAAAAALVMGKLTPLQR